MKCYDTQCANEVTDEFTYCEQCKQKHYPKHRLTRISKPLNFQFKALQKQEPIQRNNDDLFSKTFQELKDLEKRASNWLIENKNLEKANPQKWEIAKKRYKKIVYFLNLKTI